MAGIWQVIGVPCVNLSTSETLSHEKVNYIIYHIYIYEWYDVPCARHGQLGKSRAVWTFLQEAAEAKLPDSETGLSLSDEAWHKATCFLYTVTFQTTRFVCLELTKGASMLLPCGWSLLRGVAKSQNCFRRGALTCCLLLPRRLLALCIFWQRSDLVVVFYKSQSSISWTHCKSFSQHDFVRHPMSTIVTLWLWSPVVQQSASGKLKTRRRSESLSGLWKRPQKTTSGWGHKAVFCGLPVS